MEVKDSQQIRPPWLDQKFHRLLTYSKIMSLTILSIYKEGYRRRKSKTGCEIKAGLIFAEAREAADQQIFMGDPHLGLEHMYRLSMEVPEFLQ